VYYYSTDSATCESNYRVNKLHTACDTGWPWLDQLVDLLPGCHQLVTNGTCYGETGVVAFGLKQTIKTNRISSFSLSVCLSVSMSVSMSLCLCVAMAVWRYDGGCSVLSYWSHLSQVRSVS